MTTCSWNSIDFDEVGQSGEVSQPEPDYVLDYTAYHISDSQDVAAVSTGRAPQSWSIQIQATRLTITGLQSSLGVTSSLTWRGPTYSMRLSAVRSVRQIRTLADYFYGELTFDVIGGGVVPIDALVTNDGDVFVTNGGDTLVWQ